MYKITRRTDFVGVKKSRGKSKWTRLLRSKVENTDPRSLVIILLEFGFFRLFIFVLVLCRFNT